MNLKRILHPAAAILTAALSVFQLGAAAAEPAVKLRIDVDRACLPSGREEKAVVKVALDAARLSLPERRAPINLALVIDRSGSMSGDKIQKAKEAALAAVRRLSGDDVVSLIAYDSTAETLVSATRASSAEGIEQAIRALSPRGNTALFAGISQAASELRRHAEDTRYSHRAILLSDGLANVGPSSPEELGRLGAALMKEGISVSTIGLGLGFNEDLMTRLAQRSDGNTYFVESSDDLPGIFAAELGEALSIVARRVVLTIDFPEGIRPRGLVGREGAIKGQQVQVELNQLYGGQEKFLLVEVDVAPGKTGTEKRLAEARVDYEDALQQRKVTATAERKITFASNEALVRRSANAAVQLAYAENVIAVAKDKAVELNDANRPAAAAEELRSKTRELKEMATTYGNDAVGDLAARTWGEAERVEQQGMSNSFRKSYRAESAQVKSQQATRSAESSN